MKSVSYQRYAFKMSVNWSMILQLPLVPLPLFSQFICELQVKQPPAHMDLPHLTTNLPKPALVLVDGGEAVSMDSVEVVLVGNS